MGLHMSLAIAGNAIVSNRCNYDIWVWSVGAASSSDPSTCLRVHSSLSLSTPQALPSKSARRTSSLAARTRNSSTASSKIWSGSTSRLSTVSKAKTPVRVPATVRAWQWAARMQPVAVLHAQVAAIAQRRRTLLIHPSRNLAWRSPCFRAQAQAPSWTCT